MEKILKSGYEWCLDANMRILDLSSWDTQETFYDESYYKEKIDVQEFYRRIGLCRVKTNSMPRKTDMFLEYRMYGLVPYNLSQKVMDAEGFNSVFAKGGADLRNNEFIIYRAEQCTISHLIEIGN